MHNLISELLRLYLPPDTDASQTDVLVQRVQGQSAAPVSLSANGRTRVLAIPFRKMAGGLEAQHWTLLCEVANALQADLALPPPAVSISGDSAYGLWLSLATPIPDEQARQFISLLRTRYFPDAPAQDSSQPELPPCLVQNTGKWAAFINPGLGASFAEDAGLEMAPPAAGQAALLTGLDSISDAQFRHALALLQPAPAAQATAGGASPARSQAAAPSSAAATPPAGSTAGTAPDGLLLKDATLEDIVNFLHSKNIEPTFRHLIRK